MTDRIFGLIGLLLAVGYAIAAFQIQESFLSDAVGPKAFPLIIAVMMGLASVAMILRPDANPEWPGLGRLLEIAFSVAAMVLYAIFLPDLGFVLATAVAAAYLTWRLGTAPLWSLVVGVSTSVGIYVVFHMILGLSLARGPWGF